MQAKTYRLQKKQKQMKSIEHSKEKRHTCKEGVEKRVRKKRSKEEEKEEEKKERRKKKKKE